MNFKEFLKKHKGIETPYEDQYGDWLGYEISSFEEKKGKVVTTLNIRQEHLSPSSAVHGGVISGFLDFSCGCAVFATLGSGQLCSTVDLNVKYFRPIRLNDVIIAHAEVLHQGKTLRSAVANLFVEKDMDNPVAMATGTFNVYDASILLKNN